MPKNEKAKEPISELKKFGGVAEKKAGSVVEIKLSRKRSIDAIKLLPEFPNLKKLTFSNMVLDSVDLSPLEFIFKLEALTINDCGKINDELFKVISSLEELRHLYLVSQNGSAKGIDLLKNLHSLDLHNFNFDPNHFKNKKNLKNLKELNLSGKNVGQVLAKINGLPSLKSLSLYRSDISDNELKVLSKYSSIERLNLGDNLKITSKSSKYISKLIQLKELRLWGTNFGDEGLEFLGKIKSIELLDLRYCNISDLGLPYLKELTSLKELIIRSAKGPITLNGLRTLKHLPHLGNLEDEVSVKTNEEIYNIDISPKNTLKKKEEYVHLVHCAKASKIFLDYMKKNKSDNLLSKWHSFKEFCKIAIDCAYSQFYFGTFVSKDKNNTEIFNIEFFRNWFEPESEMYFIASCCLSFNKSYKKIIKIHSDSDLEEFILEVEKLESLWESFGKIIPKSIKFYAGLR